MSGLGRPLIYVGLMLVAVGLLISFGDRLPFRLGRLPGDLTWKGRNTVVYFPLGTSLLLSLILTLVLYLFGRR